MQDRQIEGSVRISIGKSALEPQKSHQTVIISPESLDRRAHLTPQPLVGK